MCASLPHANTALRQNAFPMLKTHFSQHHLVHEMDGDKEGFESTDVHGRHLSNGCSLVFMVTRQTVPHMSTQFIGEALRAQNLSDKGAGGNRRHEADFKNIEND